MKFGFGKILFGVAILFADVLGFVKVSYSVDCNLPEAFCRNTSDCRWTGTACTEKITPGAVDCKTFKYAWSCESNLSVGCVWGGPLTQCYDKNIGIPNDFSQQMTALPGNVSNFDPSKKILVIGNKNFYEGCNQEYGFVKLLNQQLNPDYVFECKSDSVFNFPYDSYENFMKYSTSNFTNVLSKYKDNSYGYDQVLLLMNFENLVYKERKVSTASGDSYINVWEEEKVKVLDFLNLIKSTDISVNMVFNPPFKDFKVARNSFDAGVYWSEEWQERNLVEMNYMAQIGGPKYSSIELRQKLGTPGDTDKLSIQYDSGDHFTWNFLGHKTVAEFLINEVYKVSVPQRIIEFCMCTSDKSVCNEKKYIVKNLCDTDANFSNQSLNTKFQCVQVNNGDACSTLVVASTKDVAQVDKTNSDLLNSLRSDIDGLNKLQVKDVPGLVGKIINTLLGILGSIALAMIMYGGITFMMASGNGEKQKKATGILVWATLGIVIIFSSYAVVNFVFDILK